MLKHANKYLSFDFTKFDGTSEGRELSTLNVSVSGFEPFYRLLNHLGAMKCPYDLKDNDIQQTDARFSFGNMNEFAL